MKVISPSRASVEHIGGTHIRYIWPCGHFRSEDLNGGHLKLSRRIPSEAGVKSLARYWRTENDRINAGPCPTCVKKNTPPAQEVWKCLECQTIEMTEHRNRQPHCPNCEKQMQPGMLIEDES